MPGLLGAFGDKEKGCRRGANRRRTGRHVACTPGILAHDALDTILDLKAPPSRRVDDYPGKRISPHPFITRISLPCSLLLPLLIAPLLFLLLGTAPSPVVAFFLIHLPLVGGGLVDLWPADARSRGRGYIGRGLHGRREICGRRRHRRSDGCGSCRSQGRAERRHWRRRRGTPHDSAQDA